jgi:hypothetical protein
MTTYYVWGGSLHGVRVEAASPREALIRAVGDADSCVLHRRVRVSVIPRGPDPLDTYFDFATQADFTAQFPELVDHADVAVQFVPVSGRT